MHKTKIGAVIFGLLVSGSIFISCHKNPPSWDAQILAPIITGSLSINDIITSSYIKNNPDSSVSLVYTDSLYNLNIDTLLNIPDTVFVYDTLSPITTTITPGSLMFYVKPTTTQYPLGSVQLVKGTIQSGYLVYTLQNPLSQPVDYFYKVYNITASITDTLEIKKVVSAVTTITDSIYLGGYNIDFSGPTHNGYNDITTSIQVNLDPNASPLTVTAFTSKLVDARITFKNVIPYYAKGYFGTTTKTYGPEKVAFPIFNQIVAGKLNLQNVSVNLTLTNGFGVDASIVLSQLSSINRAGHVVPLIDNSVVGSTIHINRATPSNNPSSPVNPTITNFAINPSNSNILAWLDSIPTSVQYALQITTDPIGNVSGSNDFAYYAYGINSNINVTIPLSLIADNLTLADTLEVNFSNSSSSAQHVKSGTLTIYATNGFPFSAGLQLYLLNTSNKVCDSLFVPTQSIASGTVNPVTGIVTSPSSSALTISLNETQTQELLNTKSMILYARFNMGNSPSTYRKIYDYYQLGVKMVGNFDYQVN